MATYAIGDVQGCREPLERLLDEIRFDAARDTVWFVGDLVNRGPDSLGVLRLVRSLGERAVTVLGNHDLHLLGRALGVRRPKKSDTLAGVLRAGDRDDLLEWLRHLPLLHRHGERVLVHAGLAPAWTADDAAAAAREAEDALRGDGAPALLERYAAKGAAWPRWSADLAGDDRLRATLGHLTRLRCVTADCTPDDDFAGPPADAPEGLVPWFEHPERRSRGTHVVFGHWAALGARVGEDWTALDSGCVWGRGLTAARLSDRALFRVPATPL